MGGDGTTVVVRAQGHEHVRAEHESTLEVTTDDWLTPAGDCIVGVEADTTLASFDPAVVTACQDRATAITVTLAAGGHEDTVSGHGHPELTFEDDRSMVLRTSEHTDDRTLLVGADKAASDLDRELIAALADGADLTVTITVA
ncbi:DUF371 domain-containing protein [Halocatena halophila]|uniref:DUF371 domain-containing protein n=1 Tax=Halocatena halophila TaxID=2814576 RepID=UPI002ED2E054